MNAAMPSAVTIKRPIENGLGRTANSARLGKMATPIAIPKRIAAPMINTRGRDILLKSSLKGTEPAASERVGERGKIAKQLLPAWQALCFSLQSKLTRDVVGFCVLRRIGEY
jgi:hypothetical protein